MTSPDYYNPENIEAIEVIEAWGLGFNIGNAIKYIARAGGKEGQDRGKDLGKAITYIHREIHGRWPWEEKENENENEEKENERHDFARQLLRRVDQLSGMGIPIEDILAGLEAFHASREGNSSNNDHTHTPSTR